MHYTRNLEKKSQSEREKANKGTSGSIEILGLSEKDFNAAIIKLL